MGDNLVPNGLSMVCKVLCSRSIYLFPPPDNPEYDNLVAEAAADLREALNEASGERRTTDPKALELPVDHGRAVPIQSGRTEWIGLAGGVGHASRLPILLPFDRTSRFGAANRRDKSSEHRHGATSTPVSATCIRSDTILRSILPGPFSGSASTKTIRRGWA